MLRGGNGQASSGGKMGEGERTLPDVVVVAAQASLRALRDVRFAI